MTPQQTHFRKLEAMYLSAPINKIYQVVLRIEKGSAKLEVEAQPELFHAAGALHGSAYFKALDDAAFFAANSLVEDVFVLTSQFEVHLLRPVTAGKLIAEAKVIHATKSSFLADAVLRDEAQRIVAHGRGTFVRSRIELQERLGYKL